MNATNTTALAEASDTSDLYAWWRFVVIVVLSLMSAMFSGLNLGIMSLDPEYLELLTMGPFESPEDEREARYAQRILPLRRRGNLLLCTILLGNVSVNAILSIVMADMTSGLMGILLTTFIVMIFGEILPQALCSRYALVIGAHTMWILQICVFLSFPISFPMSAILDKVLGEDAGNGISKTKIKGLFALYEKEKLLDPQERQILTAALELRETTIAQVMTPLESTFKLSLDLVVDKELLRLIYSKGYSRIPVYQGREDNIVGILMARDLILINPDHRRITIRQLQGMLVRDVVQVDHLTKLEPVLSFFKKGQTHMAVVTRVEETRDGKDPQLKTIGIVTLEDIIKELVENEDDDYVALKGEQLRHKEQLVLLFSDQQAGGPSLSDVEAQAVCEFLQKQVKAFNQNRIKRKVLLALLTKHCEVLEIAPTQKPQVKRSQSVVAQHSTFKVKEGSQQSAMIADVKEIDIEMPSVLVTRGKVSDDFYLVLQGKVQVESGVENFIVQLSTFSYFGLDSLLTDSYMPDFTAQVTNYARILKMKRIEYLKAVSCMDNVN